MTRAALAATVSTASTLALASAALAADLKVATTDPRDITAAGATLSADVDHATSGGQIVWSYGTTTNYGETTLPVQLATQDARQKPTLPLSCLRPGTTYHVRAVATDGLITVYGGDKKLTTKAAAPGTAPDPACTPTGAGGGASGGTGSTGGTTTPTGSTTTPPSTTTPSTTTTGDATGGTGSGAPANDGSGATTAPGVATEAVTPVLGRTLAAAAVKGTVTAVSPSGAAVSLAEARAIPTGTIIDTRRGTVELKTAVGTGRAAQVARFWGGRFQVRQSKSAGGLTQLVLRGGSFAACRARSAGAHAAATRRKRPPRSLWGSDNHGRFETRGRGSVATVRGTRWLTEDRCDGTLTTVTAGAVAVRDLRRKRTVVVTKGHHYLARVAP